MQGARRTSGKKPVIFTQVWRGFVKTNRMNNNTQFSIRLTRDREGVKHKLSYSLAEGKYDGLRKRTLSILLLWTSRVLINDLLSRDDQAVEQ